MSARDAVSPRQFGFLPSNKKRNDAADLAMDTRGESGKRPEGHHRDIDLHELPFRATQKEMSRQIVADYSPAPPDRGYRDMGGNIPAVVEYKGERQIWNGHHRIAAALARGDKSMKVNYVDLAPKPKARP